MDQRHKLTRRQGVTGASAHDNQPLDDVPDADNTASDIWADSAYRSAETEEELQERCTIMTAQWSLLRSAT